MPRRPNRFRAQAQAQKQAANIKINLPPVPKVKDLKVALQGVIAAAPEIRVNALLVAMNWYDEAADYLIKKSTGDAKLAGDLQAMIPRLTKGNKLRELGINNPSIHERELALRKAIEQYEFYCAALKPAQVLGYYNEYDAKRAVLEQKEKEANDRFTGLITALEAAFHAAPVKFKVTGEIQGRKFDSNTQTMMYGKDLAKQMAFTLKNEGILKVVSQELLHVTKIMAVVDNGQGGIMLDTKKQLAAIDQVLSGFVAYCQSDAPPARVIRKGQPQVAPAPVQPVQPKQQKSPSQPRPTPSPSQPRAKSATFGANRVGGRYKPGSVIATIYSRMADQQEHTKQELFAGLGKVDGGKDSPFNRLLVHASRGYFRIDVNGDKVRMTV